MMVQRSYATASVHATSVRLDESRFYHSGARRINGRAVRPLQQGLMQRRRRRYHEGFRVRRRLWNSADYRCGVGGLAVITVGRVGNHLITIGAANLGLAVVICKRPL